MSSIVTSCSHHEIRLWEANEDGAMMIQRQSQIQDSRGDTDFKRWTVRLHRSPFNDHCAAEVLATDSYSKFISPIYWPAQIRRNFVKHSSYWWRWYIKCCFDRPCNIGFKTEYRSTHNERCQQWQQRCTTSWRHATKRTSKAWNGRHQ